MIKMMVFKTEEELDNYFKGLGAYPYINHNIDNGEAISEMWDLYNLIDDKSDVEDIESYDAMLIYKGCNIRFMNNHSYTINIGAIEDMMPPYIIYYIEGYEELKAALLKL